MINPSTQRVGVGGLPTGLSLFQETIDIRNQNEKVSKTFKRQSDILLGLMEYNIEVVYTSRDTRIDVSVSSPSNFDSIVDIKTESSIQ